MIKRYEVSIPDGELVEYENGGVVKWADLQEFLGQQVWEILQVYQERDELKRKEPSDRQEIALHEALEKAHREYQAAMRPQPTRILQVFAKPRDPRAPHIILQLQEIHQTSDGVVIGVSLP